MLKIHLQDALPSALKIMIAELANFLLAASYKKAFRPLHFFKIIDLFCANKSS
jgi:hypothetical protein